jgi:WD40 repeat protein
MRVIDSRVRNIGALAFAADGARLFVAGGDGSEGRYDEANRGLDLLSLADGRDWHRFTEDAVLGVAVHPGGRWLYLGRGRGYLNHEIPYDALDLTTGDAVPLPQMPRHKFHLAVGPAGRSLFTYGYDLADTEYRGELVRWDQPADGPPQAVWRRDMEERHHFVAQMAADPSGRWLVTREGQAGEAVVDQVYELTLRSPETGDVLRRVPMPGRTSEELAFSPAGDRLVVRAGMSLLVWDTADWGRKPLKVKNTTRLHFLALAFHPSGRYLAATDNDRTVKVYETATWGLARTFDWDVGRLRSVCFSPDGCLAAAGSDRGKVVVWDFDL